MNSYINYHIFLKLYIWWAISRYLGQQTNLKTCSTRLSPTCTSTRKTATMSKPKTTGLPQNNSGRIYKPGESTKCNRGITRNTVIFNALRKTSSRVSMGFGIGSWVIILRRVISWPKICKPNTRSNLMPWRTKWKNSCLSKWSKVHNSWTSKRWRSTWPSKNCKIMATKIHLGSQSSAETRIAREEREGGMAQFQKYQDRNRSQYSKSQASDGTGCVTEEDKDWIGRTGEGA